MNFRLHFNGMLIISTKNMLFIDRQHINTCKFKHTPAHTSRNDYDVPKTSRIVINFKSI